MRRRLLPLAAALLLGAAAGPRAEETPQVLPAGEGRDETFHLCSACHSTMLVRRQGMSRERWDETLTWMTERHGMPPLEGEQRTVILDYLARAFPPKTAPPPSPFLDRGG